MCVGVFIKDTLESELKMLLRVYFMFVPGAIVLKIFAHLYIYTSIYIYVCKYYV